MNIKLSFLSRRLIVCRNTSSVRLSRETLPGTGGRLFIFWLGPVWVGWYPV